MSLKFMIFLLFIVVFFSSCTFLNIFSSDNPEIVVMPQAKNLEGNEIISVGNSKNEILEKWGKPKQRYTSLNRDNYDELWIYTNRTEVFQNGVTAFQLYFYKGKLTKIEQYLW